MIKGIENKVFLDAEKHVYYHKETGEKYLSVSKFLGLFKQPFDKNIAYHCAGKGDYVGMTAEEVLEYWQVYGQERAGVGTNIHNSLELFSNTTEILPQNEYLRPAILNISSKYNDYYRQYNEVILYCEKYKVAGTTDKLLLVSSHKDSLIDLSDYKTNLDGIHQVNLDKKGQPVHKYLLYCLDHLIDSKYNGYALQLSIYAFMVEALTGKKIRKLFIHYINPENPLINYEIPVPYLKYEVQEMMDWYALNHVKEVTEIKPKEIIKDEFDLI